MKIVFVWCFVLLFAWADVPLQALPPAEVEGVLERIGDTAIVMGHGPKAIHSFIDPKCSMSRRYMAFVMRRPQLLERYTYYFYLLELKRLDSLGYIGYIFDAPDPRGMLKAIMLDDLKPEKAQEYLPDEETEERIETIVEAAHKIGVYKRPYIIYNGKAK